MRYAVLERGHRVRPVLAVRIARATDSLGSLTYRAAASVELLHCASLIVDDLPCMDDADLRRDRPSVHVVYGEATAILAAFGLVALAARSMLDLELSSPERDRCVDFQIGLLKVLDVSGLIAGQSLDLTLTGAERDRHRPLMTELKTVPLFELAARAGLILSDVSRAQEAQILSFSRTYGNVFQFCDDWADGEYEDTSEILRKFADLRRCLSSLETGSEDLTQLVDYLDAHTWQTNTRHR
jgi:geranylgeranyl pyrophosphate synthase